MRILIYGINYSPELTGIGKYTGEMAEWMVRQGHDVSVITAMPYYPEWQVHEKYKKKLWYKETINDVNIYRCPFYVPKRINSKKRILHELSFVWSSSFCWFLALFKKRFDLVITINPPFYIGFFSYIYSIFKETVITTHVQDLQIDAAKNLDMLSSQKALNIMFNLEKKLLRKSDFISTLTLGMKDRIIKKGIEEDKIIILPNWVDTDFIKPMPKDQSLRNQFNIPIEDTVILYSGNMGKKQGLDLLINVAGQYRYRHDVHFIMVGAGAEKDNLENMAKEKGLTNMKFYPLLPYKELPALLATADIHLVLQKKDASDLVMPSKLTGILSAGGCAIVTAALGSSLYEDIRNHDMGILCEPESEYALKEAINVALLRDTTQIKRNARKYAENHLTQDKILMSFMSAINKDC